MLSTDDLVFSLQNTLQKGIDSNKSLHQLVKLQSDHEKLSKEHEDIQEQAVQTRVINGKQQNKIKELEDKFYLKQF